MIHEEYPEAAKFAAEIVKSASQRAEAERRWNLAREYLRGNQTPNAHESQIDVRTGRDLGPRSPSSVRPIMNVLQDKVNTVHSLLEVDAPGIVSYPATPATDDVKKSQAATLAVRYFWMAEKVGQQYADKFLRWLTLYGVTFLVEYVEAHADGDSVRLTVESPRNAYPEPGISDFDEADWIAFRSWHTPAQIKRSHGVTMKAKATETNTDVTDDSATMGSRPSDRIEVFRVFWRDGRQAILAQDMWLWKAADEFIASRPKRFPVQWAELSKVDGQLWPDGFVYPLIDPQHLLNAGIAQQFIWAKMATNPKVLSPRNSIGRRTLSETPGEITEYDPSKGPPTFMNQPPAPDFLAKIPRDMLEWMDIVSGVNAVTQGRHQPGATSGVQLEFMFNRDTTPLGKVMVKIRHAFEEAFTIVTQLLARHWGERKMRRVFDVYGRLVFNELGAVDLDQNQEIFFEADSFFAISAKMRQMKAMQLASQGVLGPEEAKRAVGLTVEHEDSLKLAQGIAHATELWELAVMNFLVMETDPMTGIKALASRGGTVEVWLTDDVESLLMVWSEKMRQPEFYDLPPERQEYVADVYGEVARFKMLRDAGQPPNVRRIWPPEVPVQEGLTAAVASKSPVSAVQQAGAAKEVADQATAAQQLAGLFQGQGSMMGPSNEGVP